VAPGGVRPTPSSTIAATVPASPFGVRPGHHENGAPQTANRFGASPSLYSRLLRHQHTQIVHFHDNSGFEVVVCQSP